MRAFFIRWAITTFAVLATAHIVPGIGYQNWGSLLAASLVLGLVNAYLKPVLMILSLPLLLLTFGLFTVVINSCLLLLVSRVVHGFHVAGWWSAFWGSLVVSLVTILIKSFQSPPRITVQSQNNQPSGSSRHHRIIDV